MPEPSPDHVAVIDGVECVDRDGVAQMTDRSRAWVDLMSSPAQRARTGCPAPHARRTPSGHTGAPRTWYGREAIQAWMTYLTAAAPIPPQVPIPDHPDELIGVAQMRVEVMRPSPSPATMNTYVRDLRRDYAAGAPSFLPKPARWVRTGHGLSPRWRRGDAVAWQNTRPGLGGRPAGGVSRPRPASPPEDPDALISETAFRTRVIRPAMNHTAWKKAIARSLADWAAGRDGVLPRPAASEQITTTRGPTTVYRWRAHTATTWQNQRAAGHNPHQDR